MELQTTHSIQCTTSMKACFLSVLEASCHLHVWLVFSECVQTYVCKCIIFAITFCFLIFHLRAFTQWSPFFHTIPYCFPGFATQLHNNTLHMPTITNYIPGCRLSMATEDFRLVSFYMLSHICQLTPPLLFQSI